MQDGVFPLDLFCAKLGGVEHLLPDLLISGLKHSGKTVQGLRLARRFNAPFIDLDERIAGLIRELHPELAAQDPGGTDHGAAMRLVRLFFRLQGREAFMALEAMAFDRLQAERRPAGAVADHRPGSFGRVISLGGGAMENPALMATVRAGDCRLFLDVPCPVLFERIMRGGIPAFLDPQDPEGSFRQLYERRRAAALAGCDLCVELGTLNLEEAARKIDSVLQEYMDGR